MLKTQRSCSNTQLSCINRAGTAPGALLGRKPKSGVARVADIRLELDNVLTPIVKGQDEPDRELQHGTTCPFLAGLRKPPMVNMPFHKRVQLQVLNPCKFQSAVLAQRGSDTVVQASKQPAFAAYYMPATADLVKEVFAAEAAGAITQGLSVAGEDKAFGTLLGEDSLLVVRDPERHRRLRALLQPAFSADAIATYLPDIEALVSRSLVRWQAAGDLGVKAHHEMKRLTFEFIMQVALGHGIAQNELMHLSDLFSSLTKGLIAWPYLDIPFTNWHRALRAQRELVSYFQAEVTAARRKLEAGESVPGVNGILVAAQDEDGARLSDQEITHNLLLVLLAGHDTSATTLTRCLSNLQDHPRVLQKLREEQQRVLTKHGPQVTAAALKDMTYADAVIRETLRRDPVVGGVVRVATEDLALGGYHVPAGSTLLVPLRHLAETDPRWAGDTGDLHPAAFNPDRLQTSQGAKSGQLMPFGAGARYCLGTALAMAEMKVFLALLARKYQFEADNNTKWKPALGYYPENGLPMVVRAWPSEVSSAM